MNKIAALFLAFMLALAPAAAQACPLCAEAVAAGSDSEDEVSYFAESMNQSIYLMIATPYTLLGFVGYKIYRGVKMNEACREKMQQSLAA